jgi:hypothetical protein
LSPTIGVALANEVSAKKGLPHSGRKSARRVFGHRRSRFSCGIGKYKILSYTAGVGSEGVQVPLPWGDRERSDRQRGVSPYGQENSEQKVIPSVSEEFSCG